MLTATAIDGGEAAQERFYVPFEDIEEGTLDWPATDQVGRFAAQDLLLRAYRLSMLHGTAPLLSLQRSRVIPKDYQLVPVVMALEQEERVRMLIADDVGLGKTVEAGLIMTELMARQRASRVLVVVPAALREQWKDALDYFFHLRARIISSRHRREMEREMPAGANPWEQFPCLITSIDYAKQPRVKNQILEQDWDVVVMDEAHLAAKPHESGPGQHATTDRHELAKGLSVSERVRHLLLLTATPHNGYTDTFASLIDLLDVGAVAGPSHEPRILRETAQRHVCQRRREDVETWFADDPERSPFPERDQDEVVVPPTSYEQTAIHAVEEYGEMILRSAEEEDGRNRTLANWTVLHLHKRALSSPEALRQSLKNRKEGLGQRLEEKQEEVEEEATIPEEAARANVLDEDTGERLTDEEAARRTERASFGSARALERELEAVEDVIAAAEKVTPSRDNKLRELKGSVLTSALRRDPKVIVFTRYVDTMEYVAEQVASDNRFADTDVHTIYGGMSEQKRREVFRAFDRAQKAVLVATDAISEGMNLQHAAGQVVHYELPWNPNRLEQRNGRVDRFGQRRSRVYIRTMVMDETLDAAIMNVLVQKAAQIRQDYGFSPPYFGEETDILELLGQHEIAVGPKQLGLFDAGPQEPKEPEGDPFSEEKLDRIRGESFYGQTDVSLPDIEERLEKTAETIGSPEEVQAFVRSGLDRFGCRVEENKDRSLRITVTDPSLQTTRVGTGIERATFDPEWGLEEPDVEVLDLGHPLVRRLVERVKQEAFRREDENYGRTAYLVTPDVEEVTVVFHLLARYVAQTDPVSIMEELLPVAVPVYGEGVATGEEARALFSSAPSPGTRTDWEVGDTLEEAFARPDLEETLEEAVAERREALVRERQAMQETMRAQSGDGAAPEWTEGLGAIAPGTYDMLTATVYYPA
jgi:ERCC4-related helicase